MQRNDVLIWKLGSGCAGWWSSGCCSEAGAVGSGYWWGKEAMAIRTTSDLLLVMLLQSKRAQGWASIERKTRFSSQPRQNLVPIKRMIGRLWLTSREYQRTNILEREFGKQSPGKAREHCWECCTMVPGPLSIHTDLLCKDSFNFASCVCKASCLLRSNMGWGLVLGLVQTLLWDWGKPTSSPAWERTVVLLSSVLFPLLVVGGECKSFLQVPVAAFMRYVLQQDLNLTNNNSKIQKLQ